MASQEYSYNQLVSVFNLFASGHSLINSFYAGKPQDFTNPDRLYPLLYVNCNNVESTWNELTYDFEVVILDRVLSDNSNETEVFSDTLRIQNDLKAYLANSQIYNFRVEPSATATKVGKEINSDITSGWLTNMKIRTDWNADICSIPGLLLPYAYNNGTVETYSPNYLTCESLTACSNFIALQAEVAALSGGGSSYTFSAGDNLILSQSGNNITYSLSGNIHVVNILTDDIITETETINKFIYVGSTPNTIQINGLTGIVHSPDFVSGGTNLNSIFAGVNHNHTFSTLTSTAHTHTVSEVPELGTSLNTKANLSGNSSFISTEISATTYYSGSTPISNIFLITANTPYEHSFYRKRGSNLPRWYHSGVNAVANSTVIMAKDIIHYCPFIVPSTQVVTSIACEVTASGNTGSIARLGIFDSITNTASAYHMQPNVPIADCGTVAIDSAGVKSISGISITLTPGLYFLTINNNATSSATFRAIGAAASPALFAIGTALGPTNATHLIENQTFTAFTASNNILVNVSASLVPIVAVQIS